MRILNNKAVSTVFGSILFIMLSVVVVSALVFTFYQYDQLSSQALSTEKLRLQEKLFLVKLETEMSDGIEYITRVLVSNEGTITSKICAVYVDEKFIFDPSEDDTINPIPYINAKQTSWVYIPQAKIPYQEESYLKMATELGSLTIEQEGKLKNPAKPPNPAIIPVFGPLQLDFEYFYYTECDSGGNFDADSWKDGSSIDIGARPIVWKIAVTNICNKDITLSKFSCLTTMPNDMSIKQRPWYIEPTKTEGGTEDGIRIESKEKLSLVYIWDSSAGTTPQTIYDVELQAKILMTFFGTFHENDGSTKPYGQTIPFQAINMRQPRLEIHATPNTIAASSTTESTITILTRTLYGDPTPNQQVTLSTDYGNLGSNTVTTNIQGIATTAFNAQQETSSNTATIIASWNDLSQSTTVNIGLGSLAISASPTTIVLDSTSTITATLTYGGAPLSGQSVTFSTTQGALSTYSPITTDSTGSATVTFTGSTAGDATITASALAGTVTAITHVHTITGISVNPPSVIKTAGETQQYTASTIPGNWDITSAVVWSTTPQAAGSWIQSTATYTTSKAGTWTVSATFGPISGSSSLTVNPAAASSLVVSGFPSSVTAGVAGSVSVTALDSYGNIATGYIGTVNFTSSDSQVDLPDDYQFVAGDGGVHTFTDGVALKTAGTQSITATDTVSGITGTQGSIVVSPADSASLTVSGFPSPVVAGAAGSVTVTVLDGFGNAAAGYIGTVHFTSNDLFASLPSNYLFLAAENGVHTFSGVVLRTAGTCGITATDTATSSITGSQTGILVSPSLLDHFDFTTISDQMAGTAYSITITAKDAYDNTVVSYTGNPDLTSDSWAGIRNVGNFNSGTGTGSVTSTIAISPSTITATDGAITGTSNTFAVGSGALNTILVSPDKVSITAGSTQAFTAEAFDAYGNSLGDVTGSTAWSIDAAAGGVWVQATGAYTSEFASTWAVTGTYLGVSGTAFLTVDPNEATYFVVSGFADTTMAGVTHDIVVTAKDSFGNTATGYSGTVVITSTDSSAVLPAPEGLTAGVGTFSVTLKTAGTQSITATDSATAYITGTQSLIEVTAGSLNSITIGPTSASIVAGGSQTYVVEAFDAFGNTLGDVTVSATFTLDGSAVGSNTVSASVLGDHIVEASYGGKFASATLTVTSGGG